MANEQDLINRRLKVLSGHLIKTSFQQQPNFLLQETSLCSGQQSSQFKYTLDNDFLTSEQREFYEKNGYLVIKGLYPQAELEIYRNRYDC